MAMLASVNSVNCSARAALLALTCTNFAMLRGSLYIFVVDCNRLHRKIDYRVNALYTTLQNSSRLKPFDDLGRKARYSV